MQLSQDELLLLAHFRSMDARARLPLLSAARRGMFDRLRTRKQERPASSGRARVLSFPSISFVDVRSIIEGIAR